MTVKSRTSLRRPRERRRRYSLRRYKDFPSTELMQSALASPPPRTHVLPLLSPFHARCLLLLLLQPISSVGDDRACAEGREREEEEEEEGVFGPFALFGLFRASSSSAPSPFRTCRLANNGRRDQSVPGSVPCPAIEDNSRGGGGGAATSKPRLMAAARRSTANI